MIKSIILTSVLMSDISDRMEPVKKAPESGTPKCPFFAECPYFGPKANTEAYEVVTKLFCFDRYDTCRVAMRLSKGLDVPPGARPDGGIITQGR